MKYLFRIIGQITTLFIILGLGILLSFEQIPGNKAICDAEQIYYVLVWSIFMITTTSFIIHSRILFNKNHWKKYRLTAIIISSFMLLISLIIRPLIFITVYGTEKISIENHDSSYINTKIKLFENGRFYATTDNFSCSFEETGYYEIIKNRIKLKFQNKKFKSIGTEYLIENNNVLCLKDCDNTNKKLIILREEY